MFSFPRVTMRFVVNTVCDSVKEINMPNRFSNAVADWLERPCSDFYANDLFWPTSGMDGHKSHEEVQVML